MYAISVKDVTKSFGDRSIFKNLTFDISVGERIGIVGNNGTGKTTLANMIFGIEKQDAGEIIRYKKDIKIGYLFQSTSYNTTTFNEIFLDGTQTKTSDFLKVSSQLGIEKMQEWDSDRVSGLSGGEKTKLALANIWVSKPDIMILDEPTNHLDFQGVEWLIAEMKKFQGTVLIISHDRYFLDQSVNKIIEIEDGETHEYYGNYSFYRDEKKRKYENQLHQYETKQKKQARIQSEIKRLKTWSDKAHREAGKGGTPSENRQAGRKEFDGVKAKKIDKQVKSKIKRLEKIETDGIEKPIEEQSIHFQFDSMNKRGKRLVEASGITKKYGDKKLYSESSFYVQSGEHIGLIGPNGCGKTTLVKMLLKKEDVSGGDFWISPTAKIAYLSQDVNDMDESKNVIEFIDMSVRQERIAAYTLLAQMGFEGDALKKPIRTFSLGERTRIKLAKLILQENDVLILDEPTNHLDLSSRQQLENTLLQYKGTILLISHDRYMIESICTTLLVFKDGKINRVAKNFKDYQLEEKQLQSVAQIEEEKLLLENRLQYILGELSKLSVTDPDYKILDEEFKELIKKKRSYANE